MWTKDLKVGDTVFFRTDNNRPSEYDLTVGKIGRKYIYATNAAIGYTVTIEIETGRTDSYGKVYPSREFYLALVEKDKLLSKLRSFFECYHSRKELPIEKAKAIEAILWGDIVEEDIFYKPRVSIGSPNQCDSINRAVRQQIVEYVSLGMENQIPDRIKILKESVLSIPFKASPELIQEIKDELSEKREQHKKWIQENILKEGGRDES